MIDLILKERDTFMKYNILLSTVLGASLLLLTGCGRLVDWAVDEFYQGVDRNPDLVLPRNFVRSTVIHDQLMTVAIFDALWLSNEVKTAFTNVSMLKQGKSEERRMAFLRRQLEENKHFISFYVLSSYKVPLGTPLSEWSLSLEVDDTIVTPVEVKSVDLDPVYQAFFGRRYNNFKNVYLVRFEAKDANDQWLINEHTTYIALHFKSIKKETRFTWLVPPADKEIYAPTQKEANTEPEMTATNTAQEITVLPESFEQQVLEAEPVTNVKEQEQQEPEINEQLQEEDLQLAPAYDNEGEA